MSDIFQDPREREDVSAKVAFLMAYAFRELLPHKKLFQEVLEHAHDPAFMNMLISFGKPGTPESVQLKSANEAFYAIAKFVQEVEKIAELSGMKHHGDWRSETLQNLKNAEQEEQKVDQTFNEALKGEKKITLDDIFGNQNHE